ncbi:MAG: ADP-ribosylglycohydrolase family protein, partial [Clostridia bacterium]|nr:ADP-ribosylglycohydrolase family protein [Clostridia bacterium]
PRTATYKNAYREWIGAQIRADYYGYINPGDPETAAEMAWRDASLSHVKNGIYGAMFVAAMLACAAVRDNVRDVILGGLSEIPKTSRLYKHVSDTVNLFDQGKSFEEAVDHINSNFNEHTPHGWCHTISNAMIVTAALLYGDGDYGKTVGLAVQTGFDTDCNGATAGSVFGMLHGAGKIGPEWTAPLNGKLRTDIFRAEKADISELVKKTLSQMPK